METKDTWRIIKKRGLEVKRKWKKLAEKNKLKITIGGIEAIPIFFLIQKSYPLQNIHYTRNVEKNISNECYLFVHRT